MSSALLAFIGSVPNGSAIVFKAGGTYRLDKALKLSHRSNLTINGNGATLRGAGGTTEASSIFWLVATEGVTIENLSLVGNDPSPGVYAPGREGAHGVLVDGGGGTAVSHVTTSAVWGDCLYVGSWATGVVYRDSTCASAGRQGVTITSGRNVTVEHVAFNKIGYCTFDIEPNNSSEGASGIRFVSNTAGTWGNSFLSADGAPGSSISGVTVSGNVVAHDSLLTIIDLARRSNIVFTGNTARVAGYGPILRFAHIDGLTVTGNVQPLSGGSMTSITDCTKVTLN